MPSRKRVQGRFTPEEGLQHLIDASTAVLSELSTDRLLEVLMDRAVELTRADRAFLMLADTGGTLRFRIGRGFDRALLDGDESPISRSVAEEVFLTRRSIRSSDALGDEAMRTRRSVLELRLRTIMCAPLIAQSRPLGVLYVDSSRVRTTFDPTGLAVFQALADLAAIALENARLYELATTDPKTGLANAGLLRARLEAALDPARAQVRPSSLILVDLDHFKRVNDTYGHPAGDLVLAEVAEILRQSVRGCDLAARYGGEEFALLLSADGGDTRLEPSAVAERVRRAIAERPFVLPDGTGVRVTASFGVARGVPGQTTPDEILANADRCLYQAKGKGRDCVVEESTAALVG